jgi:hypothetical protein
MNPIFVSFFTPNGNYPLLADKLKASLDRFELNSDVMELPQFPTWQRAVACKSKFILDMLDYHKRPVVWMDADTEVWQFPELLFGPHDFAVYNWSVDTDHHLAGSLDPDKMLCSGGVIKFGWTNGAYNLLKRWSEAMQTAQGEDDPELDLVFNDGADVNPLWLPKTYNRMDKHTHHWSSIPADQVVINHDYTGGKHGQVDSPQRF